MAIFDISKRPFKRLNIDCQLTPELDEAIDVFLNHINNENGKSEDCYRSEIHAWLKELYGKIPADQYDALKQYYVHGGIYG